MEKNQPPTKTRREESVAGSIELKDRISQLPVAILHHHILSLLSQKDAVRTCILSKSWRHLGPTGPKFEFRQRFFRGRGSKEKFVSFVEKTLQRYVDQNLSIQEFVLETRGWGDGDSDDSESISKQDLIISALLPDPGLNEILFPILNKWIPIVLMNMGAKTLNLTAHGFSLPFVVLQAEFLTELYLKHCKLDQINNSIVKLQMLKHLQLYQVDVEDVTFEKIMSGCPLVEHLGLYFCRGLSNIKVNKTRNLKHFVCHNIDSVEINEETPSLETMCIVGLNVRLYDHLHNNYLFPHLKSLYLCRVHLPTELLNKLSSNSCPCLEELQLHYCFGFTEFVLSSRSIERLVISTSKHPLIKVDIDAANILYFEYRSDCLPSISFAATSREWKSRIQVCRSNADVLTAWSLKLHEFLKSLSRSQISLAIFYLPNLTNNGGSCEPVVIEHLCFRNYFSSSLPDSLNFLFRICRPRYIGQYFHPKTQKICDTQLVESIWKTLVNKGECDFWKQDLEELSIQVSDKNTNEWHSVHVCEFSNNKEIRFRLKWREDLSFGC